MKDRVRSGRPRATTVRMDRWIVHNYHQNPFLTSTETARIVGVSKSTVIRRLRARGLRAYRPLRANILTDLHQHNRLQLAREHIGWTQRRWNNVLFSDESRFLINRIDGRERVYRRRGQRYAQQFIRSADRFGGGSVMVWGGISAEHRTPLVEIEGNLTARRYCDEILVPHVLPYIDVHDGLFQHDNARPHVARISQEVLQNHRIEVLDWPARSPDLNPIEHLWDELDRQVRKRRQPPHNRGQLMAALQEEWLRIPQRTIRNLLRSMNRRCHAVLQAIGGHTHY